MSNSKFLDSVTHNVQVYICAPETFLPPVGHIASTKNFQKINDVFVNKYEILMSRPCYTADEPENHLRIGELYTLERLLLAYLGCHGSFFQNDAKRVSGSSRNLIGVLNDTNFENEVIFITPPEDLKDYTTVYIDNFIEFLNKYQWTKDYASYIWLHNQLSKMAGNFHGIGRKGASPFKKHQNNFNARYLRGVLTGCLETFYVNLKRLKTCIESKVSLNKFNVFELQGFHLWVKSGAIWFLQCETHLSSRYGNEIDDLRKSLELVSPNIIRFNSSAIEQGQTTYASISSLTDSESSPKDISEVMFEQRNNLEAINLNAARDSLEKPTDVARHAFRTSTQESKNVSVRSSARIKNKENEMPNESVICMEPSTSAKSKHQNVTPTKKVSKQIETPKTARKPPGFPSRTTTKSTFQTPRGYNEKVGAVKDKQAAAKERKAANKQSQKRYLNFSDNDSSPEIKNKKKR